MKKLLVFAILIVSVQQCFAHREDFYFLMGTIGNNKVGVRIDEYGDNAMLRYFKLGELKEVVLKGAISKEGQFVFKAESSSSNMKVVVQETELNKWEGAFFDSLGVEQNIELEPIDVKKINHPYAEAIQKYNVDAYTALKTREVSFITTSKSRHKKGNEVIYVRDNMANISSVRIKFRSKKLQADSINSYFVATHLKNIQNALSCKIEEKPVYSLQYDIHVLTNKYISFSETVSTNCLGGKINTYTQNFNKWISTANDIILEEILWFGDKEKHNVRYSSYEWHQYKYKIFGDSLLNKLADLYPDIVYKTETNNCDYSDVKGWQFPQWYLLPKGIYFQYTIMSKDKECNHANWSLVPYKTIRNYFINDFYNE